MQVEVVLGLLILACIIVLSVLAIRRNKLDKKETPTAITSAMPKKVEEGVATPKIGVKPTPTKPAPTPTPGDRSTDKVPPAVILFADNMYNGSIRCRACDGENPPGVRICQICGKQV